MRPRYLRVLLIGAVAAALAVTATGAIAGTGIGAIFNLGKTNTVNHVTVLKGTMSTRLLQITNTGAGPALSLNVKAGTAPMQVSSDTKVAHLNADKLDGVDATGFVQTNASTVQLVLRNRLTEPLNSGNASILTVTGFGTIEASCGAGGIPSYRLFWRNGLSGQTADAWHSDQISGIVYASLAPGGGFYVAPVDTASDRVVTVTEGLPDGRVVTVTVSAHAGATGCVFYAQAVAG
ncbi:MAG: hypothetical protein ACHQNA_14570 [Acidimicrobiales bacterium]